MPNEPRWLEPGEVAELNALIVGETDEPHLVLDIGLLDSACQRPRNRFDYGGVDDVVSLAVELLFGIARNHPFQQGNKRTGFEAALLFLAANGYELDIADGEDFGRMIIAVITGEDTAEAFEDHIRPHVVRLD